MKSTVAGSLSYVRSRPLWLSRLSRHACPIGDQEVAGSIPAGCGNILSWKLIMKYIVFSFAILSLSLIQEEQLSVPAKECAHVLVYRLED